MPFIKILSTESHHFGDYESKSLITHDISDWEEVSDEDLALLKKYQYNLKAMVNPTNHYHGDLMIVELDQVPIKHRIDELKAMVAGLEDKAQKEKLKRAEVAKERMRMKEIQKAAQEKKTLAKLIDKYGTAGVPFEE